MVSSTRARALIYYEIKEYERECDLLEKIFAKFSIEKIKSILDVGCGIGSHALILSNRGYRVTGIDISKVMIRKAEESAKERKIRTEFLVQNMRNIRLNRKFDCAIMLGVFGHIFSYKDLLDTLSSLKLHLGKDGLFVFDFWNARGVSKQARAFSEAHRIRCYMLDEIRHYLDSNGFKLLSAYNWSAKEETELEMPTKNAFQILAVAKKS